MKFSENVQEVISPDLNKLPDTANCYTIFVPEKVKLTIYLTLSISISIIDQCLIIIYTICNLNSRFDKHSSGGRS